MFSEIIAQIERANAVTNQGRGSQVARTICLYLRRNDFDSAKKVFEVDSDKLMQYPVLYKTIRNLLTAHSWRENGKEF